MNYRENLSEWNAKGISAFTVFMIFFASEDEKPFGIYQLSTADVQRWAR